MLAGCCLRWVAETLAGSMEGGRPLRQATQRRRSLDEMKLNAGSAEGWFGERSAA